MKKLVLPLLLASFASGFIVAKKGFSPKSIPPTPSEVMPRAQPVQLPPLSQSVAQDSKSPSRFHWSQVESSDYQVYVVNLRRIGCPDSTIRDIISADIANLFSINRKELHVHRSDTGQWSYQEEKNLVARLMGDPVESVEILPNPESATLSKPRRNLPPKEPEHPLVFQNIDLAQFDLNPQQQETIESLREGFLEGVGSSQDPADPEYLKRWQKAQGSADDALRGALGTKTWMELQMAARTE